MRVAFFGQSGPYAPEGLRALLSQPNPFVVPWVVEGRKTPVARRTHRFIEPRPRAMPPPGESLSDLAAAAGARTLQTCDVNSEYVVDLLRREAFDALVCVGFDRLFAPQLIEAFPVAINAHPSALPQLRGPSPLFWSLRHGAQQTAVTLHAIDAGEDRGAVFAQRNLPIPEGITGDALYNAAGRLAGQMLRNALGKLATGHLVGVPQDHSQATRAPRPKAEDVRVEPDTWDCQHLLNFATAAPYFRTPWLRLGDDTFHVRRGVTCEPGKRLPAQYVLAGDTLVVQCRDGLVHLEIQT